MASPPPPPPGGQPTNTADDATDPDAVAAGLCASLGGRTALDRERGVVALNRLLGA